MRDLDVFNFKRALPRMSWSPRNLYNLWQRTVGEKAEESVFIQNTLPLNNQRWKAKALIRGYHGDHINEKIFKRWYLPSTLPDVRPQAARARANAEAVGLARWARKESVVDKAEKAREEELEKGLPPVSSLMLAEVERRIDVFIFRACMAQSVYDARRLVIHGYVMLNGRKHTAANTRLAPGDMVTVDPSAVRFLRPSRSKKAQEEAEKAEREAAPAADAPAPSTPSEVESAVEALRAAEDVSGPTSDAKKPSRSLPPWKGKNASGLTPFRPPPFSAPFFFIPAYIEPQFSVCSAIYLHHPTARPGYSEIPTPWDADGEVIRFAWEWYSKRRPRIRSKRQMAMEPPNRRSAEEQAKRTETWRGR